MQGVVLFLCSGVVVLCSLTSYDSDLGQRLDLKLSYDVAKKNVFMQFKVKKHYFLHTVHYCCSSMPRLSETR